MADERVVATKLEQTEHVTGALVANRSRMINAL